MRIFGLIGLMLTVFVTASFGSFLKPSTYWRWIRRQIVSYSINQEDNAPKPPASAQAHHDHRRIVPVADESTNRESPFTVIGTVTRPSNKVLPISDPEVPSIESVTSLSEFVELSLTYFDFVDSFGKPREKPEMLLVQEFLENVPNHIFGSPAAEFPVYNFVPVIDPISEEETLKPFHVLGKLIGSGPRSAVYQLPGHDDKWVLKYTWTCLNRVNEQVDPVLKEVYFLSKLVHLSVTIRVLYYSAPVEYDELFRKIPKEPNGHWLAAVCPPDSLQVIPILRYLILERVGMSLSEYMLRGELAKESQNRKATFHMPIADAVGVGIKIIEMLKLLHAENIVHGAITLANIATRSVVSEVINNDSEFVFIDFENARQVDIHTDFPLGENTPGIARVNEVKKLVDNSNWENIPLMNSFRDDVYRALAVMATLIHGLEYSYALHELAQEANTGALPNHKATENIFDCMIETRVGDFDFSLEKVLIDHTIPSKSNYQLKSEQELKKFVAERFLAVLNSVRDTKITEKPDFDFILNDLRQVVDRVKRVPRMSRTAKRGVESPIAGGHYSEWSDT